MLRICRECHITTQSPPCGEDKLLSDYVMSVLQAGNSNKATPGLARCVHGKDKWLAVLAGLDVHCTLTCRMMD